MEERNSKAIETARKKRECNAKAQKIVEGLIDGATDEASFLQQLLWINQSHYQDIVEERAIVKDCGYPLCNGKLGNIPKKKYHISSVQNKVYDITERKNFCSNQCYKASLYLKNQLLVTPLWLREQENLPDFVLYSSSAELIGDEVNFGVERVLEKESDGTPLSHSTRADSENESRNLEDMNIDEDEPHEETRTHDDHAMKESDNPAEYIPQASATKIQAEVPSPATTQSTPLQTKPHIPSVSLRSQSLYSKSKDASKQKSLSVRGNSYSKTGTEFVRNIESCLREWITVESLSHVLGFENMRRLMKEKGRAYTSTFNSDALMYEKYTALCRKLKVLEIEEEKNEEAKSYETPTNPLPDYEALKEQTKEIEIKVRSFYRGDLKVSFAEDQPTRADDDRPNALPLVHQHAKKVIRRNIVVDKLKLVLPDLCQILGMRQTEVLESVKMLVCTFNLSAHNITFKPLEWNLIGLVLIKLLSLENPVLQRGLQEKSNYINTLLMSYHLESYYLDLLCVWLTDLDSILKMEEVQDTS